MQDPFPFPSCFSSGDKLIVDDSTAALAATKSGQTVVSSVYRTKIAGHSRLITATWFRNLLVHGLCISIQGPEAGTNNNNNDDDNKNNIHDYSIKIELRPWYFWRKLGSKKFDVEGNPVRVIWDLRHAKFSGEPEPRSNYYVALAHDEEVVLVLGDLNREAYTRTGYRPSAIEAMLVSKKEHLFGKKRFSTRSKFSDKGKVHDISIECGIVGIGDGGKSEPEMVLKIDGNVAIHVKHLQWKFRGNETIMVSKGRVEVFWDVHDWLFSPGLRHALFIFKPLSTPHSSVLTSSNLPPVSSSHHGSCFFLYAWKLE